MSQIVFIAIAGALGALSRYGLSGLAQRFSTVFPFGTLIVNVLGCLLIGLVMHIGINTDVISRSTRIIITIGFLGAFTTFSTFSYETVSFFEDGAWLAGGLNIVSNLGLCLFATLTGLALGRIITGGV